MNFNPASVVAAAAAAAHQHPHHQYLSHHHHHQLHHPTVPIPVPPTQQLIPLPSVGGGGSSIQVGGGDTSPKIMEWTNDDALELIEQYRCHTELWNRADPKYKDKLCRFRAWSEIAERFGCSKAEVERKMNVLLTQYRREKHKMFVKIYQGIQPNPSKWYAFKRFDFMEAGGGSMSAGGGGGPGSGVNTSGGNLVPNPVSSSAAAAAHNGLNGLAAAAVAAAAYESGTIAAAGNGGAPTGVGGGAPGSQMQHRRIKGKELKYFGAMGLNIPMLIASQSQTLDSWNTAGQYSPPISGSGGGGSDRGGSSGGGGVAPPPQQLRVPLPMSYHSGGGGGGGGGGGSSSSDFQQSPLKTMDTSDNEDNNNSKEDVAAAAALGQLAAKVERRSPASGAGPGGGSVGGAGGSSSREANDPASDSMRSDRALSETGSSPIPNTNMHEAHKNHLLNSPVSARAVTPRQAHEQLHHHTPHPHSHPHQQQQQQQQQQQHQHGHEELDIKQELVDYFHGQAGGVVGGGAAPPPPPESHRSYSSAGEESRLPLVDMAQDLRVAQAKANFGAFVLPPRNSDLASSTMPTMPLNMRKLTEASSAGHMLMNSLLGSRESMSDGEDPDPDNDEATESAASPGHIKSSVSAQAAVTSAYYAESLNRDDCDFIGSNVALKLRTMDRTQRIIAEKLISEVLYYGQFNELERSARIQPK
ncbi:hypothetical protein KR074_008930 [Drosophila pseudoananassae]|nr:hypothetical protein KR074_008930 [Drosophila pseudoananassae]